MIKIKRIKRIAIAVKDLEASLAHWKKMFGINVFTRGSEPGALYHWAAFEIGEDHGNTVMTMEFLSPLNDPKGVGMIGKFIKERGEGLYMVTMETKGDLAQVRKEFTDTGLTPSWGQKNVGWDHGKDPQVARIKSWWETYVHPKDANGALITLASIEYSDPVVTTSDEGILKKKGA
jgi:hypothetical protein